MAFTFCLLSFPKAQVVTISSVSVADTGVVSLQWNYSGSASTFLHYIIGRYNTSTGTYDSVGTTASISITQYSDTFPSALLDSVRYRITAVTTSSSYSDSATTIIPTVINVQNQSEYAFLSWNRPYSVSGGTYRIFRHMPGRSWSQIAVTSLEHYQDTIHGSICSDTIFYRIEFHSPSKSAHSPQAGAWFTDPYPTTPCTLDVITVNPATQNIELSWLPSPDADIMGYFICQGSPCMALDTVWGQNSTSYICTSHSPDSINSFRIYAFDSCFSASPLTDPYNNVVLEMDAIHCTREIQFSWNEYINMPGNVSQYTLYLRYDNGPFNAVSTQPPSARSLNYIIPAGVRQVYAYLQIINQGNSKQSLSNIRIFDMMSVDTADFIYTLGASVSDNEDAITLTFLTDTHFVTSSYNLYRSIGVNGYQHYASIPFNGNPVLSFTDNNVDLENTFYRYYLTVWDECELLEKKSNRITQIRASLSTENGRNIISWTPYDGAGTLLGYKVMRKVGDDSQWSPLSTTQSCYIEDQMEYEGLKNIKIKYRVAAIYTMPNGDTGTAQSTAVSYFGEPVVFVPNAFTPSRETNNTFKPMVLFVRDDNYSLTIYNRMGLQVFTTNDPNTAWDGKYKGESVPIGSYVYILQYYGEDGSPYSLRGSVMVVE